MPLMLIDEPGVDKLSFNTLLKRAVALHERGYLTDDELVRNIDDIIALHETEIAGKYKPLVEAIGKMVNKTGGIGPVKMMYNMLKEI